MMIRRYIQNPEPPYELIPIEQYSPPQQDVNAPMVMPDIEPFRSVATADQPVIGSRSKLREYMKRTGLVQTEELRGEDFRAKIKENGPSIKECLIRELYKP